MGRIETEILQHGQCPAHAPCYPGDISMVSNEVEFSLIGANAQDVISASTDLELDPEVNQRDIVELLVSMAGDADALNSQLGVYSHALLQNVQRLGGRMYAGSSLLRDTSQHEPSRYRTTSLSETLARNLLDVTSQQIVIGVSREGNGEQFGIRLYNMLRGLTPVVLAMSASSPYRYQDGLVPTGQQSRRMHQYERATSFFPSQILETPALESIDQYFEMLQTVSDEVNERLRTGEMDVNTHELYRARENGNSHAPFDALEPHQIYWMVRPRPDHANDSSAFSIEMRVMDLPTRLQRMQAMNSFVLGLSYYAARCGFEEPEAVVSTLAVDDTHPQGLLQLLQHVATHGLATPIGRRGVCAGDYVEVLTPLAVEGLRSRGLESDGMIEEINSLLVEGNDAQRVQDAVERENMQSGDLEHWLSDEFASSVREERL